MPPRKKVDAAAAPADLNGKKPANADSGDLDALREEVAAEPDADTWPKPVPIGGTTVLVKEYLDWPSSADELLIAGRLFKWAEKILAGDDYANVWVPLDPTNRQVGEFLLALEKISGIPFVTSLGSPTT